MEENMKTIQLIILAFASVCVPYLTYMFIIGTILNQILSVIGLIIWANLLYTAIDKLCAKWYPRGECWYKVNDAPIKFRYTVMGLIYIYFIPNWKVRVPVKWLISERKPI